MDSALAAALPEPPGTAQPPADERRADGRALRRSVPRSAHAEWTPAPGRDPVAVLEQQGASRVTELLGVRYGRMAESPFAFFRGAAALMALDLSSTPTTGLRVQACGDAHITNFGKFASPERNLVFDINDFDETVPGPWEWDVKRLCASLHVIGRQRGFSREQTDRLVLEAARSYRERLAQYATWPVLNLFYERTEIKRYIEHFPMKYRGRVRRDVRRARRKDHLRAVSKLTTVVDGRRRFVESPPLVVHAEAAGVDLNDVPGVVESYRSSLPDEQRFMFDRFRLLDVARKVVGVGSVGTRCFVALFEGPDLPDDLIVLQVKEAPPSVLEPYVGESMLGHGGRRVVAGQHLIQAASDVFLGWADGPVAGRHYYVRQLWDLKGQGDPMVMEPDHLGRYGALCAWILARAHARTGDAVEIAAYLGGSDRFDRAIAEFSAAYARNNEADHAALVEAIGSGRLDAAGV
jgi:uncharacterized protein (DUF2252 family)